MLLRLLHNFFQEKVKMWNSYVIFKQQLLAWPKFAQSGHPGASFLTKDTLYVTINYDLISLEWTMFSTDKNGPFWFLVNVVLSRDSWDKS
jgi:hypothetical protein